MKSSGHKKNLYLPAWVSREVQSEAARLERSVSWVLRHAWKLARAELARAELVRSSRRSA